ncbi:uncharacterized protein LOC114367667 [Glycine soja]|uniref:uncharacterized protein LOC114367667 n=1 Tax=Glycine soja TaxID=3848 RepID=UPI00054A41AB|nr:uncharacterized protein LOC114367667 [Glycine soja]KHN35887.1 hypothetical protein glysoja_013312 [Glycine soja]
MASPHPEYATSHGTNIQANLAAKEILPVEGKNYIPIPRLGEKSLKIWSSQVLLPYTANNHSYAFLGPFLPYLKLEQLDQFLPRLDEEWPLVHLPIIRTDFTNKDHARIFRATPPVDRNNFFKWMDRVENVYGNHWKKLGIYEFMQLCRLDLTSLDIPLLMASFIVWNRSTHAFDLPCGPASPTLLDIAAITGLRPIGERYAMGLIKDEINVETVGVNFRYSTYRRYIKEHQGEAGTYVTEKEHISFLLYWLSSHVLCTPALKVTKNVFNLAQALHLGKDICLSKFLLASLYKAMDEAVDIFKAPYLLRNFSGPLWLMQLWLNAIFEKKLNLKGEATMQKVEGARLTYLTRKKEYTVEAFKEYISTFLSFEEFTDDLAPFLRPSLIGPKWLKLRFPCENRGEQSELINIWSAFLTGDIIFTGTMERDIRFYAYQPQLFARQFGLSQLLPVPVMKQRLKPDHILNKKFIPDLINTAISKPQPSFTPVSFENNFYGIQPFFDWWKSYYSKKPIIINQIFEKLTNSITFPELDLKAAEPLTLPKRNEDWESAEEEEDQLITPKASRIRKGTSLSETSNRSSKKSFVKNKEVKTSKKGTLTPITQEKITGPAKEASKGKALATEDRRPSKQIQSTMPKLMASGIASARVEVTQELNFQSDDLDLGKSLVSTKFAFPLPDWEKTSINPGIDEEYICRTPSPLIPVGDEQHPIRKIVR